MIIMKVNRRELAKYVQFDYVTVAPPLWRNSHPLAEGLSATVLGVVGPIFVKELLGLSERGLFE